MAADPQSKEVRFVDMPRRRVWFRRFQNGKPITPWVLTDSATFRPLAMVCDGSLWPERTVDA